MLIVFMFSIDRTLSEKILQTSAVIESPGQTVNLSCTHTYKDFFYLFWYQQTPQDASLKLTGFLYTTTFNKETEFEERFYIYGDAKKAGTLQISNLGTSDTGVYYCAVRDARWNSLLRTSAKTHCVIRYLHISSCYSNSGLLLTANNSLLYLLIK